jgi:hypothetical protein
LSRGGFMLRSRSILDQSPLIKIPPAYRPAERGI